MSHVPRLNGASNEGGLPRQISESCHIKSMGRILHINRSRHAHECYFRWRSHTMSNHRVTSLQINESCPTYKWVTSRTWMVLQIKESCHIKSMSHVLHINESCHAHQQCFKWRSHILPNWWVFSAYRWVIYHQINESFLQINESCHAHQQCFKWSSHFPLNQSLLSADTWLMSLFCI